MKTEDRRCGTCARWSRKMEDGIPIPYCPISQKYRGANDMKGCLAWKEKKL